ncbi:histidinol-phosphatase [archaeon CG07_land_8_20_14_0_80_38_8]|nr:MAG: histidinol-phosphatase [archaeon CG07_land_8_20_14_0_80_38_8]PIU89516.1 MAG: histidinol-phosphatase [archaeon CG06_land_8_20_14_3_00_37_11]
MKADLHTHTNYSPCSPMSAETLLKTAHKKGLDIIAITDHNKINGALKARRINPYKDLKIIIGCEKKCEYGELLIYNLKKMIKSSKFQDILREAREQKAKVFIAHPTDYLRFNNKWKKMNDSFLKSVDGIESVNGRNIFNQTAINIAKSKGLKAVAGSDAHYPKELGNTYIEYDKNLWKEIDAKRIRIIHKNNLFNKLKLLMSSFLNKWVLK